MRDPIRATEAIGIDVGGTKTAAVRVNRDGNVVAQTRRPTPYGSAADFVDAIVAIANEIRTDAVTVVGVGVPGMVDAVTGELVFAPRPPLRRVPVRDLASRALGLPVAIDNDVHTAAWAEYQMGAGRGHDEMVLVAIGTGVGCGIISRGRLLHGAHGFAAEIWHLLLRPGRSEPFDELVTGPVIARLGKEAAAREPSSWLARRAGDPMAVTGEMVTLAAQAGDEGAVAVLAEVGGHLGIGLASVINLFDPSIIVVGGGPSEAGDLLLGPARDVCGPSVHAHLNRPAVPIVAAQLGNGAGALGAALLAFATLAAR